VSTAGDTLTVPELILTGSTTKHPYLDVSPLTSSPSSPVVASPMLFAPSADLPAGSGSRPSGVTSLPPPRQPSPVVATRSPSARGSSRQNDDKKFSPRQDDPLSAAASPTLSALGAATATAIVSNRHAGTTIIQSALTSPRTPNYLHLFPSAADSKFAAEGQDSPDAQRLPTEPNAHMQSAPNSVHNKVMTVIKIVLHGKSPTYICGHAHLTSTVPFFSKGHLFCSKQCYQQAKTAELATTLSAAGSVTSANTGSMFSNMFGNPSESTETRLATTNSRMNKMGPAAVPEDSTKDIVHETRRSSAIPQSIRRRPNSPVVVDSGNQFPRAVPSDVGIAISESGIADRGRRELHVNRSVTSRGRDDHGNSNDLGAIITSTRGRSLSAEHSRRVCNMVDAGSAGLARRSMQPLRSPSPWSLGSASGPTRAGALQRSASSGPECRHTGRQRPPLSTASPSRASFTAPTNTTLNREGGRRTLSAKRVPPNVDFDSMNSIVSDLTVDSRRLQTGVGPSSPNEVTRTGRVKGHSSGYGQFGAQTVDLNGKPVKLRTGDLGSPQSASKPGISPKRSQSAPVRSRPNLSINPLAESTETQTLARKPPIPKTPTKRSSTPSKHPVDAGLVFQPSKRKAPTSATARSRSVTPTNGRRRHLDCDVAGEQPSATSASSRSARGPSTGRGNNTNNFPDKFSSKSTNSAVKAEKPAALPRAVPRRRSSSENLRASTGSEDEGQDGNIALGNVSHDVNDVTSAPAVTDNQITSPDKTAGGATSESGVLKAEHFFRAPTTSVNTQGSVRTGVDAAPTTPANKLKAVGASSKTNRRSISTRHTSTYHQPTLDRSKDDTAAEAMVDVSRDDNVTEAASLIDPVNVPALGPSGGSSQMKPDGRLPLRTSHELELDGEPLTINQQFEPLFAAPSSISVETDDTDGQLPTTDSFQTKFLRTHDDIYDEIPGASPPILKSPFVGQTSRHSGVTFFVDDGEPSRLIDRIQVQAVAGNNAISTFSPTKNVFENPDVSNSDESPVLATPVSTVDVKTEGVISRPSVEKLTPRPTFKQMFAARKEKQEQEHPSVAASTPSRDRTIPKKLQSSVSESAGTASPATPGARVSFKDMMATKLASSSRDEAVVGTPVVADDVCDNPEPAKPSLRLHAPTLTVTQALQALASDVQLLHERDPSDRTPLLTACFSKKWDLVDIFIKFKADVNAKDKVRTSFFACLSVIRYLL
jgi:hypothetical protein